MILKISLLFILIITNIYINTKGQNNENYDRRMFFPDLDNYKTLLTDFHQHTVFQMEMCGQQ